MFVINDNLVDVQDVAKTYYDSKCTRTYLLTYTSRAKGVGYVIYSWRCFVG